MKKIFLRALKICGGIVFLVVLFRIIGIEEIIEAFLSLEVRYLFLIAGLILLSILTDPLRFLVLYWPVCEKKINVKEIYKHRLFSQIIGTFTPSRVGELSILYTMKKKYNVKIKKMAYAMAIDKGITFICYLIFGIIGLIVILNDRINAQKMIGIGLILSIMLGLYLFIFNRFYAKSKSRIIKFFVQSVSFFLYCLKEKKRFLMMNVMMTFLAILLVALIGKITLFAFGYSVSFKELFYLNNIIGLLGILPLNILGVTAKELGALYLFTFIKIPAHITASMLVIVITLRYIIYFIWFVSVYRFQYQRNKK